MIGAPAYWSLLSLAFVHAALAAGRSSPSPGTRPAIGADPRRRIAAVARARRWTRGRLTRLSAVPMPPVLSPSPETLVTRGWADYALLDSGDGRKLERYGRYTVVRPEPQCLWAPALTRRGLGRGRRGVRSAADEDDAGRWRFAEHGPIDAWPLAWGDVQFTRPVHRLPPPGLLPRAGRQLGVAGRRGARPPAGQPQGAEPVRLHRRRQPGLRRGRARAVTHVDASKKAVAWARENAELSGLADRPIRWIAEDARKYVQREVRRGSNYDGIILDPPKYGRGPDGEVWRLFEDLPELARPMRRTSVGKRRLPAAERLCRADLGPVAGRTCWPRPRPVAAAASTGANWPCPRTARRPRDRPVSFFARWTRQMSGRADHLADQRHGQGRARPAPAQGTRGDRPVPGRGAEDRRRGARAGPRARRSCCTARTPRAHPLLDRAEADDARAPAAR